MNIVFAPQAWDDYCHWQNADRAMLKRINKLVDDICRDDPYTGIGKPEKLRYEIEAWSRRIDSEHRLVYRVEGNDLLILQVRYRY
ncbi:Txe/YoeB family addiction module toxin [Demequina aurantiaca]|uniref:Txe/YoeB family addiction module toxin n=1 Tax=Demequina aurantiaca TaxID=676200 RepID=UPI003D32E439